MDKTVTYRTLITKLLTQYLEVLNTQPIEGLDTELILDEARDHYMIFNIGWSSEERVKGNTLYLRLRQGKIWIEEDWTEDGIATDLLEAGVPKEDIVLAFHHPTMRPLTEFAVS